MARIHFNSDQIFESIGHKKGQLFPKDFVLDEDDVGKALGVRQDKAHAASFLDRWVNLGQADFVGDEVQASDPKTVTIVGAAQPAPPPAPDDEPQIEKTDITKLTRAELDELAAKRGVDITEAKNKDDVIAALQLAEELGASA